MKITTFIVLSFFSLSVFGKTFSEADIKKLADKVNEQLRGRDVGNNITLTGCLSLGRTLIYQYEVAEYWQLPENIKEEVISNFKTAGSAKTCFLYDINVDLYYFKGGVMFKIN